LGVRTLGDRMNTDKLALFSKANIRRRVEQRLRWAIREYEGCAGKKYDSGNGTAQVPPLNEEACFCYGKIAAYESILDDELS